MLEKRGERGSDGNEVENKVILRNAETERTSGMKKMNTGFLWYLGEGCNQQKQSQMQSRIEANFGLITKAFQKEMLPSEPPSCESSGRGPYAQRRGGGSKWRH